ncbi:phospho-sugar mutase [Alkaliphilus serpentinus]|uniref:Phosphoglucomutase n=1 Tax=Alkaliphilus serpentinus TaxID=1482731 RepID=A0A833HLV6_9FIRM|nr:phospho-sugar mutase [Alkaliphilus serpentinus]KAB3526659.1 phospho-sugar mutase [Alkaliphilus serpentinus]
MDLRTIKNYESWLTDSFFDEDTRRELVEIKGDIKEIEDRFYKDLEFGTGGIRGVIGAGTNRMNKYTVGRATQGLANYITKKGMEARERGVVIAYDSRHMSREFSEEAALILAANGIKTYLYENLRSTPQLSFSIRYLRATAGIVVTASHNPPEYNGYKVYWEDGAQITSEAAEGIIEEINRIYDLRDIIKLNTQEAKDQGLLKIIGKEMDDAFIEAVKGKSLRGEIIQEVAEDFKIVYTPLHGTGNLPVRRVLSEVGFENVIVVPQQELPDPEFSTVGYPNPEDPKAFALAIELAEREGAQIIIGTDPDCDRVGVVVRNPEGKYVPLTGNQVGALLVDYLLSTHKERNTLPDNGVIIKTIVTSEMGSTIADYYGIKSLNTLTGFKYIGEKIKEFEETGEYKFIFGYEESYGYLAGTHARDKDAVVTSMLICEMAAYYHRLGKTLYQGLLSLYDQYGYFVESLISITLKGKEGMDKMKKTLASLRNNPPKEIAGMKIIALEDYLGQKRIFTNGNQEEVLLPKADVIKFFVEDGWIALRPSGTEPKLKLYGGVRGNSLEGAQETLHKLLDSVKELL